MARAGILIPFGLVRSINPNDAMDPREADIEKHIEHVERFGAVYWDINVLTGLCKENVRREKGVTLPTCCFFYDANPNSKTYQKVTHKAEIIEVYCLEELEQLLENDPNEWDYIPNWRYQCIKGKWYEENDWVVKAHPEWIGAYHKPSKVWIKLTSFEKLNPPLEINDFRKWDGSELRGVRGAYILCP